MKEYVNSKTGEVLPFQTRLSYKNDKVEKSSNPSDTDYTLFVPLRRMVGNVLRLDYLAQMPMEVLDGSDERTTFEDPSDSCDYDIADAFEDKQKAQDIINKQLRKDPDAEKSVDPETPVSEAVKTESNTAQ